MGELANCPRCNALFVKGLRSVCENCFKEEEKKFQTVYDYLRPRKNRQATIPQIVDDTGVEEDYIYKFVKEKRLRVSQFPNLNFPCERCGKPIDDGKLCKSCADGLVSDLNQQAEVEQRNQKNKRERQQTYFSVRKDK
ncbi:hypothetical protein NC661_14580 [Aquibacillus koreensis]|uniref:Flagellar protein n=1 Tax=Aquibacillus koreensis TaxID=279446 RepID=A0A9X4AIX0_9BACI|nr:TIGR03826 family flagellar region protein [Aquibacillus koreensis]MCT2537249.1 hypothetical protein [Aquibacillus koreensis]MDC3421597.1 hypothetical protein [Aquibacillus koreensis]